ncbi:MAG: hypothetical protein KKA07_10060 [Bacteroidetes bacterium]|nr:hypothetical protein [Bacteroidota bacterium]
MKKIHFLAGLLLMVFSIGHAQWTPVSSGTTARLNSIIFFDYLNGLCSGGFTQTTYTTDGGNTWISTGAQGFLDMVHFHDNRIWSFCFWNCHGENY